MNWLDKIKTLGVGAGNAASLLFTNPSAYTSHGAYPNELKAQLATELGGYRDNRSPLDVAINYGGGYQFGTLPEVNIDNADKMAKAYQLWDYMRAKTPDDQADAWKDYQENMAGVRAAIAAKKIGNVTNKKDIYKEALRYVKK